MRIAPAVGLLILVAACSQQNRATTEDPAAVPSEVRNAIIDAPSEDIADNGDMTDAETQGASPGVSAVAHASTIPAGFVGTWGMGRADCDASTGADKGVMIIAADGLEFFESRARLQTAKAVSATQFRGAFAFSGEGNNWINEEQLTLQPGGKSLIRREFGKDAFQGTLTYFRCPRG